MIVKAYSSMIGNHSDALNRAAMLDLSAPVE
jgi:hypothetical protein